MPLLIHHYLNSSISIYYQQVDATPACQKGVPFEDHSLTLKTKFMQRQRVEHAAFKKKGSAMLKTKLMLSKHVKTASKMRLILFIAGKGYDKTVGGPRPNTRCHFGLKALCCYWLAFEPPRRSGDLVMTKRTWTGWQIPWWTPCDQNTWG